MIALPGAEFMSGPQHFHVSAAPEPGEWLLLFFSMGALWYAHREQRI